eukprot:g3980.t1
MRRGGYNSNRRRDATLNKRGRLKNEMGPVANFLPPTLKSLFTARPPIDHWVLPQGVIEKRQKARQGLGIYTEIFVNDDSNNSLGSGDNGNDGSRQEMSMEKMKDNDEGKDISVSAAGITSLNATNVACCSSYLNFFETAQPPVRKYEETTLQRRQRLKNMKIKRHQKWLEEKEKDWSTRMDSLRCKLKLRKKNDMNHLSTNKEKKNTDDATKDVTNDTATKNDSKDSGAKDSKNMIKEEGVNQEEQEPIEEEGEIEDNKSNKENTVKSTLLSINEGTITQDAFKTLFIGRLDYKTTVDELKQLCEQFGPVVKAIVVKNRPFSKMDTDSDEMRDNTNSSDEKMNITNSDEKMVNTNSSDEMRENTNSSDEKMNITNSDQKNGTSVKKQKRYGRAKWGQEDTNGISRGYGFVEFANEVDLKNAFRELDGKIVGNQRIVVDVERGRTVRNWKPRWLAGGLGGTTRALHGGRRVIGRAPSSTGQYQHANNSKRYNNNYGGRRGDYNARGGGAGGSDPRGNRDSSGRRYRSRSRERDHRNRGAGGGGGRGGSYHHHGGGRDHYRNRLPHRDNRDNRDRGGDRGHRYNHHSSNPRQSHRQSYHNRDRDGGRDGHERRRHGGNNRDLVHRSWKGGDNGRSHRHNSGGRRERERSPVNVHR